MISLGRMAIADRAGLAWNEFNVEAQFTDEGNVSLLLEQGIEAGEPWGSVTALIPTMNLRDLRAFREFLASVILAAEGCGAAR